MSGNMELQYPSEDEFRRLYWNKEQSLCDIAHLYGKHESTIRYWMDKYNIPRRERFEAAAFGSSKKNILHPDLTPSEDLAYILGVLYGDGSACRASSGDFIISMNVKTEPFARSFASALKTIGLNPSIGSGWKESTINGKYYNRYVWTVRAYSKVLVQWFKSLRMDNLKNLLNERDCAIAFIRGLYESEGSRGYWQQGSKKTWILRIVLLNKEIVELTKALFSQLGFKICLTHSHHSSNGEWLWSLEKKGGDVLKILECLKPCIKGLGDQDAYN